MYCLGDPVHNPNVIKELEEKGLIIRQRLSDIPKGKLVFIRAHGIPKKTYEIANKRGNSLIDLTCAKVIAIHKKVEQYTNQGYDILYIAEKGHPETIGTIGFASNNIFRIETKKEIELALKNLEKKDSKNIVIFSQTTFLNEKFDEYVEYIKQKIPADVNLVVEKTICNATKLRQSETQDISSMVEIMIIIGGKKSSNTNKLYQIAQRGCSNAMLVETMDDLYLNYIKRFRKVGVMAGASTPPEMIEKVVEILKNTETEGYINERSI